MVHKALLMHDYCVFPGSEEESEFLRFDQFLAYSKDQFEKDWEEALSISSEEDTLFPELMDSNYMNMDDTSLNLVQVGEMMDPSDSFSMMNGDDELTPLTPATPSDVYWGDYYELAEEVIKEDKGTREPMSTPTGPLTEFNFNLEDFGNSINMFTMDPAVVSPEFTVAPVHVPELNTPTVAPATAFQTPNVPVRGRASGRRKSEHTVRDSTGSATPEFMDVKPTLPALVPSTGTTTRGKKRLLPAATTATAPSTATSEEPMADVSSPQPTKKIKKYQINDTNNPSVRNAKAAKANRDKKKQEEMEMKKEIEALRSREEQYKNSIAEKNRVIVGLEHELAIERNKDSSATGLATIRKEMQQFFRTIIPPLVEQTGALSVQMAPGLAAGQPSVLIPTFSSFLQPNQHSQILTTHMDFENRVLTYDYNPHAFSLNMDASN